MKCTPCSKKHGSTDLGIVLSLYICYFVFSGLEISAKTQKILDRFPAI